MGLLGASNVNNPLTGTVHLVFRSPLGATMLGRVEIRSVARRIHVMARATLVATLLYGLGLIHAADNELRRWSRGKTRIAE